MTFVTEISITPDMSSIKINGRDIEIEEVITDYKIKESWTVITLKDGSVIKIKPVVTKVYKTAEKDPITGDPVFLVTSQNVLDLILYKGN